MDKLALGAHSVFCYAMGFLGGAIWLGHGPAWAWVALAMFIAAQALALLLQHVQHKHCMRDLDAMDVQCKTTHVLIMRDMEALGISHDEPRERRVLQ